MPFKKKCVNKTNRRNWKNCQKIGIPQSSLIYNLNHYKNNQTCQQKKKKQNGMKTKHKGKNKRQEYKQMDMAQ